jgi:hypothetical protein
MPRNLAERQRELIRVGALVLGLAVLGVVVYGNQALHGGFVGDAWTIRAWFQLYPHGEFFGTVGHFLELHTMQTRPLNGVYRTVLNYAFGGEMGAWFVWQIASNVLMSTLLYVLLRRLAFPALDAVLIAVLVFLFPAALSLRFWTPVLHAPLAISFAILGFLAAFSAFDSTSKRRSRLLHGVSLLLYLASLLLYEVALPIMLLSVLLYRLRVPWGTAVRRWLVDLVVLLTVALTVTRSSGSHAQAGSGALPHLWRILQDSPRLLADRLLPLPGPGWALVLVIALIAAAAFWIQRKPSRSEPERAAIRRYLAILGAGAAVVLLGYALYVPGLDYYEPTAPGIADRINAVPAIGWVLLLYASLALLALLVLGGSRRRDRLMPLVLSVGSALLVVAWLPLIATESRHYIDGFEEGQRTLAVVRAAVPEPPTGSTIWTFGQPVEISPGVPVFGNTWDMTYSVQLMYGDRSIRSYVDFPGTYLECRPTGVVPGGNASYPPADPPDSSSFASRYGTVYFVDTVSGQFERIDSRAGCLQAIRSVHVSPPFPVAE